jgi:hypothetical protein
MAVTVIAGLASAGGAWAAGGFVALSLGAFAGAFAIGAGLSMLSRALAPKPSFGQSMAGTGITVREPDASRKLVYGRARVGGAVVFLDSTGSKNEYLHMVIAIAGHEIDGYEEIWFNDQKVWDNFFQDDWGSFVHIGFYDGSQTTADPTLVSSSTLWTSEHILNDTAYLYVRLKYDADQFSQGLPNISAVIRGKKIYNPSNGNTEWTQNPALCVYDYLTDSKYGLAEQSGSVNLSALLSTANLCNQQVALTSGGTQARYTLDGVVDTANSRKDNLEAMLSAMAGNLVYSGGEYFIRGAEYSSPTVVIDESVLSGGIEVQTKQSRRSLYNGVKGVFLSEDDNYTLADYPAQISSSYSIEDGDPIYLDLAMPFTTNSARSQRIAKIVLLRSRQQTTINLPCNLTALKFKAGDNIMVTNSKMGWNQKVFEVIGYDFNLSSEGAIVVNVQAIETTAEIYDWASSDEKDYLTGGEIDLYNGRVTQPPTNLTAISTTVIASDGTLLPSIRLNWTASEDAFVTQYEVQYQRGSALIDYGSIADEYITSESYGLITEASSVLLDYGSIDESVATDEPDYNSSFVTTTQYILTGVTPSANYNIRVRAINELGVRSNWVTLSGLAEGDTDAPSIPESVIATGSLREITLSWIPPTDPDYSHVQVWENNVNNPETATKIAIAGGDYFSRTGLGYNVLKYYWLKSVDYSGNVSDFSAVASATTLFVDSDSFSEQVNNLFSEAGAYGIEPVATLPAVGDFDGQIKYDTTNNKLWRWDATSSVWTDDIFSIEAGTVDAVSFAEGIEPIAVVTVLPNPSGYTGPQVLFLTTDNKLYRYTGTSFVTSIPAADVSGALAAANFPSNLRPIEIVTVLPTTGNFQGRQVFLTTDNKTYRYTGTAFIATIATVDLQGTITNTQIAAGAVTNAKIAVDAIQGAVIAAGAITASKILDGAISELKLADDAVTNAKIAVNAITSDVIAAGAITSEKITANAVTSLKLADDAVTNAKLAVDAVSGDVIAAGAITSEKLLDGAVNDLKLASNAVTTAKIALNAVTADVIAAGAITETKIASDAVTNAKIAIDAIQGDVIAAGAITATKIGANAVTTAKIALNAVTADVIAAEAITTTKIASDAITTAKIAANAITASEIAANAITSDKIIADAITTAKISAGAVTADEIAANSITTVKIAADAITANEIAANAVTADAIAANTITAAEIAAGAITADEIAANAITSEKISANAITAGKIAADAVTASTIAADAITADKIAAGAVVAESLAAGSVTTAKIAAGAITADEIAAAAITTEKIAAGAVTADEIAANSITSGKIAADTITAAEIAAGAITALELAAGSVTTEKLDAAAITSEKIAAGAIISETIAADAITSTKIQAGAVVAESIAANAITTVKIAAGAVTADEIAAAAITAGKIDAGAVTATEIAAGAITTTKLAAGAVTADTIASNAITSVKIAADAITANKIATGAVTADSIFAGSITTAAIAADAITADLIAADAVTANSIAANAITSVKIDTDAITAGKIQAGAVGADAIAANAITSVKIFAEAITTDKIAANSITGGLIAASGVITNTAQINDGLITNAKIGNLAVTSAKIANLAVTTGKIANLSVDTLQIAGNAVTLPTGAFTIGNLFPFYQYDNISINYATAQSVTFTESAGTSTEIFWSFFGDVMSGDSDSGDLDYARIYVRLRRNGTVILDYGKLWYLDTGPNYKTGMVNGSYQHIGSSGIATYTLEIGRQGNNIQVSKRNLITMELKK